MEIKVSNKKAYYDYKILEEYCAGLCLQGSEVKVLKESKGSLVGAFCQVENDGIWLIGSSIPENPDSSYNNHTENRKRKLLLNKKEIKDITKEVEAKGKTIIPLQILMDSRGFLKLKIGIAQGKKSYDKRNTEKEKELSREISDSI